MKCSWKPVSYVPDPVLHRIRTVRGKCLHYTIPQAPSNNRPQIPCNVILKRTTPKLWLPTLTLVWGIVATLMGCTQNLSGFFAVRFFLGVAESGLFPGVVYYLSNWYKRTERVYRVALFFSAASLAGAFGGILAWGIGHMAGVAGQKGWRWIFWLE